MFRGITAPPGGGKSRFAMERLIRLLHVTDENVVTNLAVEFEPWVMPGKRGGKGKLQMGLHEFMVRSNYKGRPLRERIRLLDDLQVKEFWRYRIGPKGFYDLPEAEMVGTELKHFPEPQDFGVTYFIDELHDHFNSHEWAKVGKPAIWYITKHRHYTDDVWGISQAMGNVVKQFRNLVQETYFIRNMSYEKWGVFTMGSSTLVKVYMYCPVNFKAETPMFTEHHKFGLGKAQETYNTAGALKGKRGCGDVGKTYVKGVPWWVGVLGFIVVLVLIWWATTELPKMYLERTQQKNRDKLSALFSQMDGTNRPMSNASTDLALVPALASNEAERVEEKPRLYMTGYILLNRVWRVFLSDGRILRADRDDFQTLEEDRVLIDGEWLPLRTEKQERIGYETRQYYGS